MVRLLLAATLRTGGTAALRATAPDGTTVLEIAAHHGHKPIFEALAHPTRREILRLLRGGEMTAGELAARFDMSKPSVSHHFAALKQADMIGSRRDGQQIYYFLNTTVMEDVLSIVWDLFGTRNGQKDEEQP